MNILAIDTSSKSASCALMEGGKLIGEFFNNAEITHSQTIMPMVDYLLRCCRRSMDNIDVLAVAVGPGSYTGLRIGLSIVKGLAFSNDIPCAPVSTLKGLAYNVELASGVIVPVMDARRNQVYTALFSSDGESLSRNSEDMAIPIEVLKEKLVSTAGGENAILVGDGALLCKNALKDSLPKLRLAPVALLHQRASSICIGAEEIIEQGKLVSAKELEPNYLRLPQAQRELEEKSSTK